MPVKKKYKIIDTLHENDSTIVHRAIRIKDNKSVILKSLKPSAKNGTTLAHFNNEQDILSQLKSKHIVKLLDVISIPSEHVHIFEDAGGTSLYDLLLHRVFTIAETLDIALCITKALALIHKQEFIHADISPKNVIYNPETGLVQIIDFGHSFCKYRMSPDQNINTITSGNLFYMSPEQTGMTLSKMDERSDLYSLGMTLYHLLLGHSPFEAIDRQELIHKQIAMRPLSLHTRKEGIPEVLSDIIDRLIQKDPNARYQSSLALEYDIKQCIKGLNSSGEIPPFDIATQDRPKVEIGVKIFGREDELKRLREEAKKPLSNLPIRILVSGVSGIGKARLVEAFLDYFDPQKFQILKGSFEQTRVNYSYFGLRQLFTQLHTMQMSQTVKSDFSALSDRQISLLAYLFPELKKLFPRVKTTEFSDKDTHNGILETAVSDFLSLVATQTSPLILVLSNLQWADDASLQLIQKSIIDARNPYISLICTYSDHEEDKSPVSKFVQYLQDRRQDCHLHITLLGLEKSALVEMFEHVFGEKSQDLSALASIVHTKTGGNPFYVKSFIEHVIEGGDISFERGKWSYSLEKIQTLSSSINIAEIITKKFEKLDKKERSYLQHLAVLGHHCDLDLAIHIMESLSFSKDLHKKVFSSDIIDVGSGFCQFAHTRIYDYIYRSISQDEKRHIHQGIGKYLQGLHAKGLFTDTVTLIHHLNSAHEKGPLSKRLFLLNLTGLEEMLAAHAYDLALETANWIKSCFTNAQYSNQSAADVFRFRALKVRIFYLNALHEDALRQIRLLINDARTTEEKLLCFTLFKDVCVTQGKEFNALLDFGNIVLTSLGLKTPLTQEETHLSVQALQKRIRSNPLVQRPNDILQLTAIEGRSHQNVMSLLVDYWEGAYYLADIERMQWAYLTILEYSFKHGNSTESCFAYVLYGAQLVSEKSYDTAYLFGEVSLKLNARFGDKAMLPKVHNFVANFISPYSRPLLSNLPLYQKSLSQSKLNGDFIFGTWANFLMHFSHFLSGTSLETCRSSISLENSFILGSGDAKMIAIFKILIQTIDVLQDAEYLDTDEEEAAITMWEAEKFYPGLAWYGIIKAQDAYLDGEYQNGLDYLVKYVHTDSNEVIMFPKIRLHFIRALLLMGKSEDLDTAEEALLDSDLNEFASFAKISPRNFKFETLLLKAENSKGLKSHWDTAKHYDLALKESRKTKNPFQLALAGLAAGRFWDELHYDDLSRSYFNEAIIGFNQWGAYAKAKRLKQTSLAPVPLRENIDESTAEASSYVTAPVSNLQMLVKPFFKMTQAPNNAELISVLMKTILETATASKAVLILKEENLFKIKAELDFKEAQITTYDLDLGKSSQIPHKLISYAINTEEKVYVNYPAKSGKFQSDSYIKTVRPASCLVLPTSLEGSITGILYLENENVITPLSEETQKTLELLLTQAAIVFKNTSLFESIIKSQENLNKAQAISHVGSWQYNSSDNTVMWSAETYRIYEIEPFTIDIDYAWFLEHLHPDDTEYLKRSVEKALKGDRIYDVQHRIITVNGTIKTVRQRASVFMDSGIAKMSGTIQDITEETKAKELIFSLSQVVDQNPFTTIITNTEGVITHVNAQTHKMTGYTDDELLGNNMKVFSSKKHPQKLYQELWKTIKDDKAIWRGTLINKMKNGELRDCASTIFPVFNTKHEIVSFVTIQEDVTEHNIKEKLFLMQTRQAQMGEMLSMIAHQWRQPLAIISALMNKERVNIALNRFEPDTIISNYDDIETQVMHLSDTINDFRDFFKPDKKAIETTSSTIITKALALSEHILAQSNIKVKIDYIVDSSYITFEREVEQVLLNLISNAKDAIVERNIKNPSIILSSNETNGFAVITIEDNAKGIDESVIDTLFLPYTSTKLERHGTGLGLYMCKTIIEDHCHGKISSENTQDGAKFTLSIPLKATYE